MLNQFKKVLSIFILALASLTWLGCGDGDPAEPAPNTYTIGGTISGLAGQIQLQLLVDGASIDIITVTDDGSFTFDEEVEDGSEYEVEPFGSLDDCPTFSISNASGTANGNVTTVSITCS